MRISSTDFVKSRDGVLIYSPRESEIYPAQNLDSWRLEKRARILSPRALSLNGTDEYAYRADSAILTPGNKLTVQARVNSALPEGYHSILGQYGSIKSWYFHQYDTGIKLALSQDGTNHNTVSCFPGGTGLIKYAYDGAAGTIRAWWNMSEVTVNHGDMPSSLANSANNLTLGASYTGDLFFYDGQLRDVAFKFEADDHGGPLDPLDCIAYYPLHEDLNDISGNDLHLTGVGIAGSNYVSDTAPVVLFVTFPDTVDFDFLMLDRRHNMQTGSTVKLLGYDGALLASAEVTAGQAVAVYFEEPITANQVILELDDTSNPDGYIEIPDLRIGTYSQIKSADRPTLMLGERTSSNHSADLVGSARVQVYSEPFAVIRAKFQGEFPLSDYLILRDAARAAARGELITIDQRTSNAPGLFRPLLCQVPEAREFINNGVTVANKNKVLINSQDLEFTEIPEEVKL